MGLNQAKDQRSQRRRPPPIEINNPFRKADPSCAQEEISPQTYLTIDPKMVFPYHIDEENEVIYKMANNGTWTMKPRGEKNGPEHAGKWVRWAEVPQTLEFNYDWVLTKIAAETRSADLRRLINQLMLIRAAHDITEFPTHRAFTSGPHDDSKSLVPVYGTQALLNSDGSYVTLVAWDHLLKDVKNASKLMQIRRRWNMAGQKKVARWCRWGRDQLINNRTEFVEDLIAGYVIERRLDGHDLPPIGLGYRRRQECEWDGNVKGPWDPETRTEFDKAVTAWWDKEVDSNRLLPPQ
ncbi:hypothetical protein LTR84_001071 [Exophiala bonariae]|uniref:HSA domain-containing protein n=1 Tax=Exophiala bonariae TaxID=1690606 RepID=A0AAV9NSS6_9EURO|nr:hypothetical protein LTR84_001071 [Exophiala bonariae]